MSAKNEAFVTVKAKCPVCTRESRHRYVKSKLYTPLEVESDQHVVRYKWDSPIYEGIHPPFYFIWHCTHCHFCEESDVFRGKDKSGGKLELIQEKILISRRSPNSLLNKLGRAVDLTPEYVAIESALAAHLLAIFIQELLTPNNRQYGKLARFYLRTAWLYREKADWEFPEQNLPEGFASYADFFASLQPDWPEIPLDERGSLAKAIHCFEEELNRSSSLNDIRREVTVMFLLVDLYLRIEDLDQAHKNVRNAFQLCTGNRQATRKALDHGVHNGKLNQVEIERMRNLIQWLNNAIDRASELSDKVNDLIFESEYPRAREVVLGIKQPTPKAIVETLRESEFHEVTCRRIAALFKKKTSKGGRQQADADAATALPSDTDEAQNPTPASKSEEEKGGFWSRMFGG